MNQMSEERAYYSIKDLNPGDLYYDESFPVEIRLLIYRYKGGFAYISSVDGYKSYLIRQHATYGAIYRHVCSPLILPV